MHRERSGGGTDSGMDAVALLQQRGERLTPQRLLVLDAVREAPGHVSAETVFARITAQFPYINRTTVYRNLAWLKDQGVVSVTDLGGGEMVYEYLTRIGITTSSASGAASRKPSRMISLRP